MLRPKNEPLFRSQHRNYKQLTPKIPAKTPMNLRQRKLAGQSSALPANRSRIKDKEGNFNMQHRPTHRLNSIRKQKTALTQQQIKNSRVYKLLMQEMVNMSRRQEAQIQKMQQVKRAKQKQYQEIKQEQHGIKLQIWQLRNETMELKDSIRDEKDEMQRLMEQLGVQEQEQNDDYVEGQEEGQQVGLAQQNQQPQLQGQKDNQYRHQGQQTSLSNMHFNEPTE